MPDDKDKTTIIVNGRERIVTSDELSFSAVLALALRSSALGPKLGIHRHLPQWCWASARWQAPPWGGSQGQGRNGLQCHGD